MDESPHADQTPVSIRDIAQSLLNAYQHQHDVLACGLAAARLVNEEAYERLANTSVPHAPARLRFEQAKDAHERLLQRIALSDALTLLSASLDQCFNISVLSGLSAEERRNITHADQRLQRAREEFSHLDTAEKLTSLNQFLDLDPQTTHDILTWFAVGQRILARAEPPPQTALTLRLTAMPTAEAPPSPLAEKHIAAGEIPFFSKNELLAIPTTLAGLTVALFKALQAFGQQLEKLPH